jgi:putative transposase
LDQRELESSGVQAHFVVLYYNRRPHSSLDRQTPDQVYFNARTPMMAAA